MINIHQFLLQNNLFFLFIIFFAFISLKNIRFGIYIIIFLLPLYFFKFYFFDIPTTILELMIYTLFILWIAQKIKISSVFAIVSKKIFSKIFNTLKNKNFKLLDIGIFLLFFGVITSSVFSDNIKTSLGILKGWFFDPFLFFIVFIDVIKKRKHIVLSLIAMLLSGTAVSAAGILYLINNDLTYDGRLRAFFLSPNHLAMYIAPAFLICFSFLIKGKESVNSLIFGNYGKKINYLISTFFLIIISFVLYFTFSYGAYFGIFFGILYIFIKIIKSCGYFNNSSKKSYFIFIFFIISAVFTFLSFNKIFQIYNLQDRSSLHSRFEIWNSSFEIMKDNALFGIGPGMFQEKYLSYSNRFNKEYLEWAVPQPHNIFLAFYLQAGFFGFLGFILIILWFFKNNFKKQKLRFFERKNKISDLRDKQNSITLITVKSIMIYILFHGIVDTTYWKNDLSLIFWMIIGISVVFRNLSFVDCSKKRGCE